MGFQNEHISCGYQYACKIGSATFMLNIFLGTFFYFTKDISTLKGEISPPSSVSFPNTHAGLSSWRTTRGTWRLERLGDSTQINSCCCCQYLEANWRQIGISPQCKLSNGKGMCGRLQKMWNASRFCVSSLRRGHANLLCIVPILVYVLPKQVHHKGGIDAYRSSFPLIFPFNSSF